MSYIGQTSRYLIQKYREHICYIRNNDPQSAYAQHILRNQHEYGSITVTMTLLEPIHKTSLLIPYEQLFIQTYQHNGTLITEQTEANKLPYSTWPSIPFLRHNSSITNEYLLYDTHESVSTQQRERIVVDPGM